MKLSLFFAAFLPILAATTLNDPCDICPLKLEALKNNMKSNKEEIIDKMERKSEGDIAEKMRNLEQKMLESENKADLKFTMLMVMREFSDIAKKMETLDRQRTQKFDQMTAQIKSGFQEMSSGFDRFDILERKMLEKFESSELRCAAQERNSSFKDELIAQQTKDEEKKVNSTLRCGKAKLLNLSRLPSGVYFYFTRTAVNWKTASNFCLDYGMNLAIIETAEEMKKVTDAAPAKKDYWVGGSDLGQLPGHFVWTNERQVDDALWNYGEPAEHGSGKETCVRLVSSQGKLYDSPCGGNFSVICELGKIDQLCL